jgi:hypothetical protein
VGANVTFKVAVCAGERVTGVVTPLALNPAPLTVICEIVMLELPALLNVAEFWLLLPTFTLPKLKLVGFAESVNVAATPVPLKARGVFGELGSLLARVKLPLTLPADWGAKTMLKVVFCPAPSESGTVSPVTLNPAPATVCCVMLSVAFPELVILIDCELFEPVTTLPNDAEPGVNVN